MTGGLTFGSLLTGIGGMDLGLDRAGLECKWQVENNEACRRLLFEKWPDVPKYGDIREFAELEVSVVDVVCGGDPCPSHSRARSNGKSVHPDLAGYFLAVVGRLRPRWVVRENVPAPTVDWFDAALNALGYRTVVVRLDAVQVTCQSRQRDFVVGCHQTAGDGLCGFRSECESGAGNYTTRFGTRPIIPCLTTHRTRYDSRDCYVWEPRRRKLRLLDGDERDAVAGFPDGWTAGFSETTRARMCGNAVVPKLMEWVGLRIARAEEARRRRLEKK